MAIAVSTPRERCGPAFGVCSSRSTNAGKAGPTSAASRRARLWQIPESCWKINNSGFGAISRKPSLFLTSGPRFAKVVLTARRARSLAGSSIGPPCLVIRRPSGGRPTSDGSAYHTRRSAQVDALDRSPNSCGRRHGHLSRAPALERAAAHRKNDRNPRSSCSKMKHYSISRVGPLRICSSKAREEFPLPGLDPVRR